MKFPNLFQFCISLVRNLMDTKASRSLNPFQVLAGESHALASSTLVQAETTMDQDIWSSLPADALESVMLWLPLRSLLRARSVCREWDRAIRSKSFTQAYSRVPKQNVWLLIFLNNDTSVGVAYDSSLRSWFVLPFSFVPVGTKIAATAGGLLCLTPKECSHRSWIICNPICKSSKEIPSPPGLFKLFFRVVGLFIEDDARSFSVVMAGSELVAEDSEKFILRTEVYDSNLDTWKKGGSMLLDAPLSPWKATMAGRMFCVTSSLPYQVLAYNVKQGFWFEVKAPVPEKLTSVSLVNCEGRLLMVGGIGENGITLEIGIWKLSHTGKRWTDIAWMPRDICNALLQSLSRRFVCIGHGNLLYFSNKKCHRVLEYNLLCRSWQWIPISPSFVNIHYNMLRGFHFQPRLQW